MQKYRKIKKTKSDIEREVMTKISSGEIEMKPKWYFIAGSFLTFTGLVGSAISAIFLMNITLFLIRKQGQMCEWKIQMMFEGFPFWIPFLALFGFIIGLWMLKKYDFSYKKNPVLIIVGFVIALFLAAWLVDFYGFNERWAHQGPMRRFYQQFELDKTRPGWNNIEHRKGRNNNFN